MTKEGAAEEHPNCGEMMMTGSGRSVGQSEPVYLLGHRGERIIFVLVLK